MTAPTGQKTNESRAKGNPITKPNGLHSQNSPSIISLSSFSAVTVLLECVSLRSESEEEEEDEE